MALPSDYPNIGFSDQQARAASVLRFRETIEKLRDHVIDAQVEASVEKRRDAIVEAAKIACRMMTDLWEGLDRLITATLEGVGVEDKVESPITFGVLIANDTDLTYLTGRDNFRALLRSIANVVELQGNRTGKAVASLVENTVDQFEKLKGQTLATKKILKQIGRVRRAVCRPPFDGGGGIVADDPKDPDGGGGGGNRFLRVLRNLADDVSRIVTVATLFGLMNSSPVEQPKVAEPGREPAPTELPAFKALVVLLMFCAIAERLIDEGLIGVSTEVLNPDGTYQVKPVPPLSFAGAGLGIQEKTVELALSRG